MAVRRELDPARVLATSGDDVQRGARRIPHGFRVWRADREPVADLPGSASAPAVGTTRIEQRNHRSLPHAAGERLPCIDAVPERAAHGLRGTRAEAERVDAQLPGAVFAPAIGATGERRDAALVVEADAD